jgi:hypothetical protein
LSEREFEQLSFDAPGPAHAIWRGAPETERQAARVVAPISGRQRCQYALAIVDAASTSTRGLTDHEAHALGIGSSYHVAGTRRKELVDDDGGQYVLDSGHRRLSPHGVPCAVWVARPALVRIVGEWRAQLEEKARAR